MLSDAGPRGIVWAGTSGGWLGAEHDRAICAAIQAATSLPATTTTLATEELLRRNGARRVGFATPYIDEVCIAVQRTYTVLGFVVEILGAGVSDNRSIARIPSSVFESQARELAARRCEAVVIFCTNVRFAELAEPLERELGVLVLDSVAVSYWAGLQLANPLASLSGYGRMFKRQSVVSAL
jgi:maleate isomerase